MKNKILVGMRLLGMFAAAVAACGVQADVKLAAPFNDGMVLQRERPVAVWGTAAAGEKVTVAFAGQSVSTTAGAEGRWLVRLAPMKASDEGRVLTANGASVKDVLVGEVWLCSGQSNMSMVMWSVPRVAQHGNRDNNGYLDEIIYPLVPYTFRGALWYQGESNRTQGMGYKDCLNALWNGWSKAFENPEMPFYLVQIAPFFYNMKPENPGASSCDIWEAEETFAKENPYAGMATIVDVGERDNIHPGDKRTVALRLAALALNRTYGRKDVPCDNPAVKSWTVKGDVVTLAFDHVQKWVMHGLDPAPFEIAGPDGVFKPAKAKYLNGAVELRAAGVAEPKQVRYLWNWCGKGRLKNDCGLPLPPFFFRTLAHAE